MKTRLLKKIIYLSSFKFVFKLGEQLFRMKIDSGSLVILTKTKY